MTRKPARAREKKGEDAGASQGEVSRPSDGCLTVAREVVRRIRPSLASGAGFERGCPIAVIEEWEEVWAETPEYIIFDNLAEAVNLREALR